MTFPPRSALPVRTATRLALGLACAASSAPATPAAGQAPGRAPAVVEIPASSRAMALGHAFQLGASDSDVVFYHPAFVDGASGFALGLHRLSAASLGLTASAAADWFGGGVAIGLQVLEYGAAGPPAARPGGLDPFLDDGPDAAAELAASVAYARALPWAGLRLGVAGKLFRERIADDRAAHGALDVGLGRQLGPLRVALTAQNLGSDVRLGGDDVEPPDRVTLGVGGYGRRVGPLDVGLAAAVTRRADGEGLLGGGIEVGYWPLVGRTFVARIGARTVPEGDASALTLGGSYWGDELVLDYAFQPVDDAGGAHRLTVAWR